MGGAHSNGHGRRRVCTCFLDARAKDRLARYLNLRSGSIAEMEDCKLEEKERKGRDWGAFGDGWGPIG